MRTAAEIDARRLEDARRQFGRIFDPTIGGEEASKGFDLLVGLAMYKVDPEQFLRTLVDAIMATSQQERLFKNIFDSSRLEGKDKKLIEGLHKWPESPEKKKYILDNFLKEESFKNKKPLSERLNNNLFEKIKTPRLDLWSRFIGNMMDKPPRI